MGESRTSELLQHHEEDTLSHRRKKYLSAGLAGVLCSTALFDLTAAHADGKTNLPLPGMRDRSHAPVNSFTRMFPELPPFAPPTDAAREQAKKLGEKGGRIDALDDLSDPKLSITEPGKVSPSNPDMPAGVTFFGQFLDHDVTLGPRSPLLERSTPGKTTNLRTAAFDLNSVSGSRPKESAELYDVCSGEIKLHVEPISGSALVARNKTGRVDLPRDPNNNALLRDSRNDDRVPLAQFNLAMLRFHNAVIDHLRKDPVLANQSVAQIFTMAQGPIRWHDQWIILHEFLPLPIGQERVTAILKKGLRFYAVDKKKDPWIPSNFPWPPTGSAIGKFVRATVWTSVPQSDRSSSRLTSTMTWTPAPKIRTRTLCVSGSACPVGLSIGQRSSISAMVLFGPTSGLTASAPAL